MRPLPRSLIHLARAQNGLLTAADLERERYVGRARSAALDSGLMVVRQRGVYAVAGLGESFEQNCLAALLGAPDAVLSGTTAARIWGLRKVGSDDIHILAHRTIRLHNVIGHQTDLLTPTDIVESAGLRVLRPGRLLCDLAAHLDRAALESVFEQMLDRNMLTVRSARAAARRFSSRGRPGSVHVRQLLDSREAWLRPADSDLELRLWRAINNVGVLLDRQVPVRLDSGRTVHVDLADVASLTAIEVDHVTWHGGRLDAQADKKRDRELARVGWTVSRVTDEDIDLRLSATVEDLLEILAHRRTRIAS